jgi:uncharacterized membrane protein (GlpM family)
MNWNSFERNVGWAVGKIVAICFILIGLLGSLCAFFPLAGAVDAISGARESSDGLRGSIVFLSWLGIGYFLFFGYIGYLFGLIKRSAPLWITTIVYNLAFPASIYVSLWGSNDPEALDTAVFSLIWFGALAGAAGLALFFDTQRARLDAHSTT